MFLFEQKFRSHYTCFCEFNVIKNDNFYTITTYSLYLLNNNNVILWHYRYAYPMNKNYLLCSLNINIDVDNVFYTIH